MQEFDEKDDTFNKVREKWQFTKQWEMTSVLLNSTATLFQLIAISNFFPVVVSVPSVCNFLQEKQF